MRTPSLADAHIVTRHLRAAYRTRILVAAVRDFHVFDILAADGPIAAATLQAKLKLAERPFNVLLPSLKAMGMIEEKDGLLQLTGAGCFLVDTQDAHLANYVGLERQDPSIGAFVRRLRDDGAAVDAAVSYVADDQAPSPMDDPVLAEYLTMALAGRAELLAPLVAEQLPTAAHLLDVAGGSGFFTYEWLRRNPASTATLMDRAAVLDSARNCLARFTRSSRPGAAGVAERVTFLPGDMLTSPLPQTHLLLAASLFHDWPTVTCQHLMQRFADAVKPGGTLWIHETFLDDDMAGPLPAADYSAQLFWVTKGRLYSRAEYRAMMLAAGLVPTATAVDTAIDYALISATKPKG